MKKNFARALFLFLTAGFCPILLVQAQSPQLIYHTILSGDEAVPAVITPGKGLLTLVFNADRSKVRVSGMLVRLTGEVTGLSLQIGNKGEISNNTVLDLLPITTGRLVSGELDAPAELLPNLVAQRIYVSVRTTTHPKGEIRGQLTGETDLEYQGVLTGKEMVPTNASTGIAVGGIHFPTGSDEIVYAFLVRGLSGPITGGSLYEGAPGTNGALVGEMTGVFGNLLQGLIEIKDLGDNFLQKCIEGKCYAVIKTAAFPNGEVRGQISFMGYLCSFAPLNGSQVAPPPASTSGFGFVYTTPNPALDSLRTTVFMDGISPTSVSLHSAAPGVNTPPLYDLKSVATPGMYTLSYPLSQPMMTDFVEGRLYVSVATEAYPKGEIRGQLKNNLRKGYDFDLCGSQMAPPNSSTALGIAMASVDQNDCYINYNILTDGLSGAPTQAHLSAGAPGQNGSALYPVATTDPLISGMHSVMASQAVLIENGGTYMVIHSPAFPDGEIRGQIRRGLSCPLLTHTTAPNPFRSVSVYPVPVEDVLHLEMDGLSESNGLLVCYDALGKIVLEKPIRVLPGKQHFQIPTEHLPPGVYHLSLEIPGQRGMTHLQTVLKQAP